MTTNGPILIAYDGSEDARHAIGEAARLVPGAKAIVLYARQPLESLAAHLEGHPALEDVRAIDAGDRDAAERIAADGAGYANVQGLDAEARVASSVEAVADAILATADEVDASLVVLGSRGRRGLKSILLGSVSHHVLHHARRPALVIPSAPLAAARSRVSGAVATAQQPAVAAA